MGGSAVALRLGGILTFQDRASLKVALNTAVAVDRRAGFFWRGKSHQTQLPEPQTPKKTRCTPRLRIAVAQPGRRRAAKLSSRPRSRAGAQGPVALVVVLLLLISSFASFSWR